MLKHLIAIAIALPSAALADTGADQALDRLPVHYAEERAPRVLDRINRQVNALPLVDCKASAFEKVRRLEAYGVTAIFITVRTDIGGSHAIAVVDGKWALDSLFPEVMTVDLLRRRGYKITRLRGEP